MRPLCGHLENESEELVLDGSAAWVGREGIVRTALQVRSVRSDYTGEESTHRQKSSYAQFATPYSGLRVQGSIDQETYGRDPDHKIERP